jgi:hypothetical protein
MNMLIRICLAGKLAIWGTIFFKICSPPRTERKIDDLWEAESGPTDSE